MGMRDLSVLCNTSKIGWLGDLATVEIEVLKAIFFGFGGCTLRSGSCLLQFCMSIDVMQHIPVLVEWTL